MFEVLVESGNLRPSEAGSRALALSVHCAAVLLAGLAVRSEAPRSADEPRQIPVGIYVPASVSPSQGSSRGGHAPGVDAGPAAPDIPVTVPTGIPDELPTPILGDSLVIPRDLAARDIWGRHTPDPVENGGGVRLAGEVDEPVTVLRAQMPVYPPALVAAGVSGEVRLEFVVDTTGRCEPGSVRVLRSTQAAFERSAIEAVLGTVFRAARARGRAVRQLVNQSVAFQAR